jgi:hypothetical protein
MSSKEENFCTVQVERSLTEDMPESTGHGNLSEQKFALPFLSSLQPELRKTVQLAHEPLEVFGRMHIWGAGVLPLRVDIPLVKPISHNAGTPSAQGCQPQSSI